MRQLRDQPTTLNLREDVVRMSALLDLVMSDKLEIDPADLVRMVAVLVQVKA
jgi:hypothetical protein